MKEDLINRVSVGIKKIVVVCLLFVLVFDIKQIGYAENVEIEKRTDDNLMVRDDVELSYTVKKDILKTPKVDASIKVYDFADVLSDTEEKEIYNKIQEFYNIANQDMVIVVIRDNNRRTITGGKDIEKYTQNFYNYNDFGVGNTHDGIILVIDIEDRNMQITTTGWGQLLIDQPRVNEILSYLAYDFKSDNWYKGCMDFANTAIKYGEKGISDVNEYKTIDENGRVTYKERELTEEEKTRIGAERINNEKEIEKINSSPLVRCIYYFKNSFLIAAVVVAIFLIDNLRKFKKPTIASNAKIYMIGKPSFKVKEDTFKTSNTISTIVQSSSGRVGGSGSSRHGGGSRRF